MEGRVLMPWESKNCGRIKEENLYFRRKTISTCALCRKYGITRKTGYKWLKRHAAQMPLSNIEPQTI